VIRLLSAVLACAAIACGRVDDAVDVAADAEARDARDAASEVDPTCVDSDGGCKTECRGLIEIADLYVGCRRHTELVGCSHHEGTCTPPDRCLYDPTTGAVAFVRCSTPPPGWIDCPEDDDAGEWIATMIHGPGPLPCEPPSAPGTCVVSTGATSTTTSCAPGETCAELGCRADYVGSVHPCGAIKCACSCDDPARSTCSCHRP
jgi:hypothetical protein